MSYQDKIYRITACISAALAARTTSAISVADFAKMFANEVALVINVQRQASIEGLTIHVPHLAISTTTELKLALRGQHEVVYETIRSDDPPSHPAPVLMSPLPFTTDLPETDVDARPSGVHRLSAAEDAEGKPWGILRAEGEWMLKKSAVRQVGGGRSGEESMVMAIDTEVERVEGKVDKGKRRAVGGVEVATAAAGTKQWRMQLVKSLEMVGTMEEEEEEAPPRKKDEDEEDEEEDEEDKLALVKKKVSEPNPSQRAPTNSMQEVTKEAPRGRVLSKVKRARPACRDEDEDDIDPCARCKQMKWICRFTTHAACEACHECKVKCLKSVAQSQKAREEGRHPAPSSIADAAAAAAAKITELLMPMLMGMHKMVIREWHGHPMHKEGLTLGAPPSSRMLAKSMKGCDPHLGVHPAGSVGDKITEGQQNGGGSSHL
ncbi:hypothetical protein EW146_g10389 [Bondarzewia mesenterica]|uniref:Zn(2)-C6 fungal-type domain-containing protein n=1 Tax=Bondarzewia mesenterica TaxID=1095465 RepID=A0A4S4KYP9_9AGAM|nr:hypothetical protein EW146_g10389 [Bondarzewia mesenterica]